MIHLIPQLVSLHFHLYIIKLKLMELIVNLNIFQ